MDFFNYPTAYHWAQRTHGKQVPDYNHFYGQLVSLSRDTMTLSQLMSERNWLFLGRPYYNIYPKITEHLLRLKEANVMASMVKLPEPVICFRFSSEESLTKFRTVLVAEHAQVGDAPRELIFWMDQGETELDNGKELDCPVLTFRRLVMDPTYTLEQAMNALEVCDSFKDGIPVTEEETNLVIRIIVSCCLISRNLDDGLIEADVLTADREKYLATGDARYVDKAKRRGKFGWSVGRTLVVNPHWRNGCPIALYWTGPGRKIPLYRPRAGAIVHRKKIESLPTGYGNETVNTNKEA